MIKKYELTHRETAVTLTVEVPEDLYCEIGEHIFDEILELPFWAERKLKRKILLAPKDFYQEDGLLIDISYHGLGTYQGKYIPCDLGEQITDIPVGYWVFQMSLNKWYVVIKVVDNIVYLAPIADDPHAVTIQEGEHLLVQKERFS